MRGVLYGGLSSRVIARLLVFVSIGSRLGLFPSILSIDRLSNNIRTHKWDRPTAFSWPIRTVGWMPRNNRESPRGPIRSGPRRLAFLIVLADRSSPMMQAAALACVRASPFGRRRTAERPMRPVVSTALPRLGADKPRCWRIIGPIIAMEIRSLAVEQRALDADQYAA